MNSLLLYDTDDADVARDILDFLWALDVPIKTIIHDANVGRTLHAKEQEGFDQANVFVFLLTPGSVRKGVVYPSQSVCDEMGRAKERFKEEPWRIINLVDSGCQPQTIDQSAYIRFDRSNHRSVVQALTALVRELRRIGALQIKATRPAGPSIAQIAESTSSSVKRACAHVATLNYASIQSAELHSYLKQLTVDPTEANLLWQELMRKGWFVAIPKTLFVRLSDLGFELVRYERSRPYPAFSLGSILKLPKDWGRSTQ